MKCSFYVISFNGSIIWARFINLTAVCWCLWFPAGNIVLVQTAHTQIRSVFVFWKHNFPVGSSAAIAYQPAQRLLQLHLHWQGVRMCVCVCFSVHTHTTYTYTPPTALSCRWSHNHNTKLTHTLIQVIFLCGRDLLTSYHLPLTSRLILPLLVLSLQKELNGTA